MRTTIDLPDDIFREAKTRAVQQGITLKNLITYYIRTGLGAQPEGTRPSPLRRNPPPVAIRRVHGQAPTPARTNRELNAILEEEELRPADMRNQDANLRHDGPS